MSAVGSGRQGAGPPRISLPLAVFIIAISAPLALAFETLFRVHVLRRVLGPDLDLMRELFSPTLTDVAWGLAALTVVAGAFGTAIIPRSLRLAETRARAQSKGQPLDDGARRQRAMERLFLLTSIPQVPAIFATFCFTFGSRIAPVIAAMIVSTIFVAAQGLVVSRLLRRPGSFSA